jgi:hypothetical protein
LALKDLSATLGNHKRIVEQRWLAMSRKAGVGSEHAHIAAETLIDDGSTDILAGGVGRDWVVGRFSSGPKDRVLGKQAVDQATAVG